MKLFKPEDRLPNHNQYVLAFFPDRPWNDEYAKNDEHKWVVVQFRRGISELERKALPVGHERKRTYRQEDEGGNNMVPYCWDTFGPGSFFGQEAELWCELPEIEKLAKTET